MAAGLCGEARHTGASQPAEELPHRQRRPLRGRELRNEGSSHLRRMQIELVEEKCVRADDRDMERLG